MEKDAIEISAFALGEYTIEKDMAAYIKKEFDKKYSPTWHVVIGTNYGSHVVRASPLLTPPLRGTAAAPSPRCICAMPHRRSLLHGWHALWRPVLVPTAARTTPRARAPPWPAGPRPQYT